MMNLTFLPWPSMSTFWLKLSREWSCGTEFEWCTVSCTDYLEMASARSRTGGDGQLQSWWTNRERFLVWCRDPAEKGNKTDQGDKCEDITWVSNSEQKCGINGTLQLYLSFHEVWVTAKQTNKQCKQILETNKQNQQQKCWGEMENWTVFWGDWVKLEELSASGNHRAYWSVDLHTAEREKAPYLLGGEEFSVYCIT